MINVSDHPLAQARGTGGPRRHGGWAAAVRERSGLGGSVPSRLYRLASFLRRLGDRWFAVNDTEAFCWGWQITRALGGLSRRYRDTRFDTLAACARCAGARAGTGAPCVPCLGTGRITLGEVS